MTDEPFNPVNEPLDMATVLLAQESTSVEVATEEPSSWALPLKPIVPVMNAALTDWLTATEIAATTAILMMFFMLFGSKIVIELKLM